MQVRFDQSRVGALVARDEAACERRGGVVADASRAAVEEATALVRRRGEKVGGGPTGARREKAALVSSLRSRSRRRLDEDAPLELLLGGGFLGAPRCTRPAPLCSRDTVSGAARDGERAGRRRGASLLEEEATAIAPRRREEELANACDAGVVDEAAEPRPVAAIREAPTPMLPLAEAPDAVAAAAACCIL